MNKELELCDSRLSFLLKKAGFDWECEYKLGSKNIPMSSVSFFRNAGIYFKNNNYSTVCPTLELAKQWFREVHKIEITLVYGSLCEKWMYGIYSMSNNIEYFESDMIYKTYEQALSEGLKKLLNYI